MKIISVSRGFTVDHSSTSYEFLAVDEPLNAEDRRAVRSLSRRCRPGARRVSFIYHVEGYDIPGGWTPLMQDHYDVMYSESYDWWTLVMAFPAADEERAELAGYEFSGDEGLGVQVYAKDARAIVVIHCRISPGFLYAHLEEGSFDAVEGVGEDVSAETEEDFLLNLLVRMRSRLMAGDYQPLYAVWEAYGNPQDRGEEEAPPEPPHREEGADIAAQLASLLDRI